LKINRHHYLKYLTINSFFLKKKYFGIAKGTTKALQTIYKGYRTDIEWI